MRRLTIVAAAIMLAVSASTPAYGWPPTPVRVWITSAGMADMTTCTSGNTGAIDGAYRTSTHTRIDGWLSLCRDDGKPIAFGLEFFTAAGASGHFVWFEGASVQFQFYTAQGLSDVTALCVATAANERVTCRSVTVDAGSGAVALAPIAVTDPLITPSGPMRGIPDCGAPVDPDNPIPHPTCATCV